MPSSTSTPRPHILTTIPVEIWLNILTHLNEADFLSLKLSSPHLHALISANASTICNNLIINNYAREAAIIGSRFRDGWLVPTHPAVAREEKKMCSRRLPASATRRRTERSRAARPVPVMGMEGTDLGAATMRIRLSEPGPQYLRFLAEHAFEIRVAHAMYMDVAAHTSTAQAQRQRSPSPSPSPSTSITSCSARDIDDRTPQEKLDSWIGVFTVRRFLARLQCISGGAIGGSGAVGGTRSFLECGGGGRKAGPVGRGSETEEAMRWFYV